MEQLAGAFMLQSLNVLLIQHIASCTVLITYHAKVSLALGSIIATGSHTLMCLLFTQPTCSKCSPDLDHSVTCAADAVSVVIITSPFACGPQAHAVADPCSLLTSSLWAYAIPCETDASLLACKPQAMLFPAKSLLSLLSSPSHCLHAGHGRDRLCTV